MTLKTKKIIAREILFLFGFLICLSIIISLGHYKYYNDSEKYLEKHLYYKYWHIIDDVEELENIIIDNKLFELGKYADIIEGPSYDSFKNKRDAIKDYHEKYYKDLSYIKYLQNTIERRGKYAEIKDLYSDVPSKRNKLLLELYTRYMWIISIIIFAFIYPVRYSYYLIRWSIKTLKESD